jgi:hypothetical protein
MLNLEPFQRSSTRIWRGELAGTAGYMSGRPKLPVALIASTETLLRYSS